MIVLILKSSIIVLLAACVARVIRRRPAAVRHIVWTAGLVAALAVPLGSLLLPSWELSVAPITTMTVSGRPGEPASAVAVSGFGSGLSDGVSARRLVFGIWIAGAATGLVLLLGGGAQLGWIAIRAKSFRDTRWLRLTDETSERLGLRRPVRLLQYERASLLGTWGVVRPTVLLPANAESWPESRIRMVLGHELAHVKRFDWPIQILADAARAIHWFNPVFWLVSNRLRTESEYASDDSVIRSGVDSREYAEELIALTRILRDQSRRWFPVLAMAQPSHMEKRLTALLDRSTARMGAAPWAIPVVVILAIVLTAPLVVVRTGPPPVGAPVDSVDRLAAKPIHETLSGAGTDASAESHAVVEAVGEPVPAGSGTCRETPSVVAAPPSGQKTVLFGTGPWYINEDRSIWVWDQPWVAGEGINTVWIRPEGADLRITGRRLDQVAEPLEAHVTTTEYPASFKASGLLFPSEGCWEVTASAGESRLTFVTRVGR